MKIPFKNQLVDIYENIHNVYSLEHSVAGIFREMKRMFVLRTKYKVNIMSTLKTLEYIKEKQCSVARYGDGEFNIMHNVDFIRFQKKDSQLAKHLEETLTKTNDKLLLCVPITMNTFKNCKPGPKHFWRLWGRNGYQEKVVEHLWQCSGKDYVFGDTEMTRPYADWKNKKNAKKVFDGLKSIWDNRDIIIVEGDQTRLGVNNDFLTNAKSKKRIIAPAKDAYSNYSEIKQTVIDNYNGELVLLALGPTATVLAGDLSQLGIQALDMGHADIEYEWFCMNSIGKVAVKGKYVNEVDDGRNYTQCDDPIYQSQIIANVNSGEIV